jgi:hypothetical protein
VTHEAARAYRVQNARELVDRKVARKRAKGRDQAHRRMFRKELEAHFIKVGHSLAHRATASGWGNA